MADVQTFDPSTDPILAATAIIRDMENFPLQFQNQWRALTPLEFPRTPTIDSIKPQIELKIAYWYENFKSPKANDEKAWNVLNYLFQIAAGVHGFHGSPPFNILDEAKKMLEGSMKPGNASNPPSRNSRIQTRSNHVSFTSNLRGFIFDQFPVFNLWDAIALTYLICAEPIHSTRRAELHLYQLYLFQQTISLYTANQNENRTLLIRAKFNFISSRRPNEARIQRQGYSTRFGPNLPLPVSFSVDKLLRYCSFVGHRNRFCI